MAKKFSLLVLKGSCLAVAIALVMAAADWMLALATASLFSLIAGLAFIAYKYWE